MGTGRDHGDSMISSDQRRHSYRPSRMDRERRINRVIIDEPTRDPSSMGSPIQRDLDRHSARSIRCDFSRRLTRRSDTTSVVVRLADPALVNGQARLDVDQVLPLPLVQANSFAFRDLNGIQQSANTNMEVLDHLGKLRRLSGA